MLMGQMLNETRQRFPDKPALWFGERRWTYAELDDAPDRIAAALHIAGVRAGDRVALFMPNCPEELLCYFACFKIGAITVPMNYRYREPEAEYRGGIVIPDAEPRVRYVFRAQEALLAARGNRIAIHHSLGRVVCVIEIVSPGNKGSRSALRSFVEKSIDFLKQGVHLLVVDLFPPSVRDPQGMHKAIWDEIEDNSFALPPDKQLTLAAYVADLPLTAYVEPVAVGDPLTDMPAFLDADNYVPVPLETTYQATWASCPEAMRTAVETGLLPAADDE